jgi:hypothetical protein
MEAAYAKGMFGHAVLHLTVACWQGFTMMMPQATAGLAW